MLKLSGKKSILCLGVNTRLVSIERRELLTRLADTVYLDHAGTTLYSKSLMERFMSDMMSNLYGNPHSASASSQLSTGRIEDTRLKALRFFNADPDEFDLVFVANATAGIKLVMEAFRGREGGFSYGYHQDAHTSLVGVRESASSSSCLHDEDVESWLSGPKLPSSAASQLDLFAYPAQSNMDGRRLPLSWSKRIRDLSSGARRTHTLLDASSLVSSSQLDLSSPKSSPDFTVLSFYKIFGFPDLGALMIRKEAGSVFRERKYFGGGTVDMVLCLKEQWHAPKTGTLHDSLEDGTLPVHSILALNAAIDIHKKLYGTMDQISAHTTYLAKKLHDDLTVLRHSNQEPVCVIYSRAVNTDDPVQIQGPIVAFNLLNSHGSWVSNTEFEKLATIRKFHVRTGGVCNPGGVAACLNLEPWEMRSNFSSGFKCGNETDIYAGKITGVIRASIGAMSTLSDVEAFVAFIREFYVEHAPVPPPVRSSPRQSRNSHFVESLTIYPIKSCGGFSVPTNTEWEVRPEGLAWDREWCLVHEGTGQALSQKRHPRMALFRPQIDFREGVLRVRYHGTLSPSVSEEVTIPLSANPSFYKQLETTKLSPSNVCGDSIVAHTYDRSEITSFFSEILGVPCALARFPAGGFGISQRHAKAHMQKHQGSRGKVGDNGQIFEVDPNLHSPPDSDNDSETHQRPILLSNESPILAINRSSLDALNEQILKTGGKPAPAAVFRANIVIASSTPQDLEPYSEDHWTTLRIGLQQYQMLGSCRRCHMICVDQNTAEKNEQPFVTLAKTRRFDSKVFFGSHMCHLPFGSEMKESQYPTIKVGDVVEIESGMD